MRQLNTEEKELTTKGINRLQEELTELDESLKYNLALKDKEKYLRIFDDTWRERLRNHKDDKDEDIFKQLRDLIKEKESTIETMNKHLTEGVENTTPAGVQ